MRGFIDNFAVVSKMSLPAETQLGRYKIIAPIGVAAMGEVYRARDTRLQRDVALKTLPLPLPTTPIVSAASNRRLVPSPL